MPVDVSAVSFRVFLLRGGWLLLALPVAASVVHGLWPQLLGWDRAAIASGEGWRLVTAHLVHLNAIHALLNLLALALTLALLHPAGRPATWFAAFVAIALSISALLYWREPQLSRYVGASGVIHGLIAWGAVARLATARIESLVLLTGLAVKLAVESRGGPMAGSAALIGAPVITAAHRYGAAAGVAFALAAIAWRHAIRAFSSRRQL